MGEEVHEIEHNTVKISDPVGSQDPSDHEKALSSHCEAVKLDKILKIDITSKEQQKTQSNRGLTNPTMSSLNGELEFSSMTICSFQS